MISDKLINAVKAGADIARKVDGADTIKTSDAIEVVLNEPAVEAGKVVHCRDCQSHGWDEFGLEFCRKGIGRKFYGDWFCADGERKDDDD
jgi:hypothetical protein